MEKSENQSKKVHLLAIPYPSQGHINPMLQFCKRLIFKSTGNLTATIAVTNFIAKTNRPTSETVRIDTISDGFDEGGFAQSESIDSYLQHLQDSGTRTLTELIKSYQDSGNPVHAIVYDSFLPWVLDVAKDFGLVSAAFFTQPCAVNFVYYYVHHGLLKLPVSSFPVMMPGLPPLDRPDMPSFIAFQGSYPSYFEMVRHQFLNADKADFVVVNTFYELEIQMYLSMNSKKPIDKLTNKDRPWQKIITVEAKNAIWQSPTKPSRVQKFVFSDDMAVDEMTKLCHILTIGPTLPSFYLDNQIEHDSDYCVNLHDLDSSTTAINWLNDKPKGSVVYVAFGSMATLEVKQMQELAYGLKQANYSFLWVVRASEESKLPEHFLREMEQKCMLVKWSPQLKVLSNPAIGCFFSHGGWNSTIEALSLGVPMVVMPQWTDQTMNAKLVQDVWNVGVRVVADANGFVGRDEVERCLREVVEGEGGREMKENALKWMSLAKAAVSEGGTSDKCIDEFLSNLPF